ncbi:phage tail tube protein [Comamonadaceae bacterium PP-2]
MTGKLIVGRGVHVEIARLALVPIAVSAVTLAKPGVATTAAAHNLVNGQVGFFGDVEGMQPLDGQAVRVKAPAGSEFTLEGLDTTSWPDFISGNFYAAASWLTLSKSTGYSIGGAELQSLDATTLIDEIDQNEAGSLSAQTFSLNSLSEDANSAAMEIVEAAAFAREYLLWRIRLKGGAQRILRAAPSVPGEELTRKELGTSTLSTVVKGRILRLPAVGA